MSNMNNSVWFMKSIKWKKKSCLHNGLLKFYEINIKVEIKFKGINRFNTFLHLSKGWCVHTYHITTSQVLLVAWHLDHPMPTPEAKGCISVMKCNEHLTVPPFTHNKLNGGGGTSFFYRWNKFVSVVQPLRRASVITSNGVVVAVPSTLQLYRFSLNPLAMN